ncbi:hypothetical protein [Microcoleus sp. AT3-A2]|uniref:hypothetical protein n=1 Tax=Microcoleus sp. AT3-A2 TaxID=2818610 RepID=UPI002FD0D668
MLATDSWVQSPILQDNLLSQFKLNQEIGDDRDRLRDLYSGSELDRGSQEQENSIPEIDQLTPTEAAETLPQLPNRGENRHEFPIPNPRRPNPAPLP